MRCLFSALLLAVLLAGCGAPSPPAPDAFRRPWQGPGQAVASEGITFYDRRELAQRVPLPTCLFVGDVAFRYQGVLRPEPPGLLPTGYALGRWRLLSPAGTLAEQQRLFVVVLGSTGIAGEYVRLPQGSTC
ncbi:MAG: hypothetical protein C4290_14345 [Chloroflexota bacterium]